MYGLDPSVVQGTLFGDIGWVFEGAWPRIMAAIQKAAGFGIGVLIGELTDPLEEPCALADSY